MSTNINAASLCVFHRVDRLETFSLPRRGERFYSTCFSSLAGHKS